MNDRLQIGAVPSPSLNEGLGKCLDAGEHDPIIAADGEASYVPMETKVSDDTAPGGVRKQSLRMHFCQRCGLMYWTKAKLTRRPKGRLKAKKA